MRRFTVSRVLPTSSGMSEALPLAPPSREEVARVRNQSGEPGPFEQRLEGEGIERVLDPAGRRRTPRASESRKAAPVL